LTGLARVAVVTLLGLVLWSPAVSRGQTRTEIEPPSRGPDDATLKIVEFSDFQCPYCALAHPALDSLLSTHPDDVRLVYRHFPLRIHQYARHAAIAAAEAARRDRFWAYHDILFRHQERLTDVDLVGYADSLGLDGEVVTRALREEGPAARRVEEDIRLASSLGIHGTPTFFINGYRLVGPPPVWVLEEALRAARGGLLQNVPSPGVSDVSPTP